VRLGKAPQRQYFFVFGVISENRVKVKSEGLRPLSPRGNPSEWQALPGARANHSFMSDEK